MTVPLITTIAGEVTKLYQYSQDGDLLAATVDSLLTTFTYNGDGRRLSLSVAGEVTTYTLDYARNGQRVLREHGGPLAASKHYLYGIACIGEHVDAGLPTDEWRYYQQDGSGLVRQSSDSDTVVTPGLDLRSRWGSDVGRRRASYPPRL